MQKNSKRFIYQSLQLKASYYILREEKMLYVTILIASHACEFQHGIWTDKLDSLNYTMHYFMDYIHSIAMTN